MWIGPLCISTPAGHRTVLGPEGESSTSSQGKEPNGADKEPWESGLTREQREQRSRQQAAILFQRAAEKLGSLAVWAQARGTPFIQVLAGLPLYGRSDAAGISPQHGWACHCLRQPTGAEPGLALHLQHIRSQMLSKQLYFGATAKTAMKAQSARQLQELHQGIFQWRHVWWCLYRRTRHRAPGS